MKLTRYHTYTLWDEEGNPLDERPRSVFRVFDVLEWRDSIRAAVEAERAAVDELIGRAVFPPEGLESYRLDKAARIGVRRAWRALDALLADGDA